MTENRSSNWKWWGLVVVLGFLHLVIVLWVDAQVALAYYGPRSRPIGPIGAPDQPPWLYYAVMNTFGFPASVIFRIARPGLKDGAFVYSVLVLTGFVWGCVWAEPFRRSYGWKPWRFSLSDVLVITTVVAAVLGLIALLN